MGLEEYGKVFGTQRFLKRAPEHTQEIWEREKRSLPARSTVRCPVLCI